MLNDDFQELFDIRRLALLVEVVEQGSVTAAAEAMMYTPSAVSQQVRKLEQEVGQPLLTRRSRGVVPTEAGQLLAGHARKIVAQMQAAQADLAELAGLKRGSLTIGTFPTLAGSFLPVVLRTFKKRYPAISLSVRSARFDELLKGLHSGAMGLCLLWDYPWNQAMVSVGMGVAMVPKTAVALQHPDVKVISLGPGAPSRRVFLAQRQDKVYAPAEVAFHSTLLEVARERAADYR